MCNKLSYFFLLSVLFVSCKNEYKPDISTVRTSKGTEVFQPDSASIASHYKIPDWFSDSKFGIFIHWGPASGKLPILGYPLLDGRQSAPV